VRENTVNYNLGTQIETTDPFTACRAPGIYRGKAPNGSNVELISTPGHSLSNIVFPDAPNQVWTLELVASVRTPQTQQGQGQTQQNRQEFSQQEHLVATAGR
jgi:hypothetical protein